MVCSLKTSNDGGINDGGVLRFKRVYAILAPGMASPSTGTNGGCGCGSMRKHVSFILVIAQNISCAQGGKGGPWPALMSEKEINPNLEDSKTKTASACFGYQSSPCH